jgi:hypothetical protein
MTFDETLFPACKDLLGNRRITHDNHPFSSLDPPNDPPADDPPDGDLPFDLPSFDPSDLAPPVPPPAIELPLPPVPLPEAVPPPVPHHQRQEPVGAIPPPVLPERPRRERAGRNPLRARDNVYGDEPPSRVDARIDPHGRQQDSAESALAILAQSQYKAGIPSSHWEAMRSQEASKWRLAEQSEYDSLLENGTWVLVPRPKDQKIVANHWVYDIKHNNRYKAWLVAKGFTQIWGQDYHETFSPVARFESVCYITSHAALNDWEIDAMDVKTAVLNGDLEEEICMEQPEGWVVKGKEDCICLLKKAIYGLKQALQQWNKNIHSSLLDLSFDRTYSDAGVYVYRRQGGSSTTLVVLYVDNLLIVGDSRKHINSIKLLLGSQYKMVDLGPITCFLGLCFRRDRSKRLIFIDQEDYISSVLERFNMADCKPSCTPLLAGAMLERSTDQVPASDSFRSHFQSIIGSILYAMLGMRPDIAFAVTCLSRYNSNPNEKHLSYAKYILRYLQGTKDLSLLYDGDSNAGLIAYSDLDWAEDKDDRRSVGGFIILQAQGAVSWLSRCQPTISLLSTEAEYKAGSDCCRQIAWLCSFGWEISDDISHPTLLCLDNQGAIFLSVNPAIDWHTKHIEIYYHYICEFYNNGEVDIFYVATAKQLANSFTKNVPFSVLDFFRHESGLRTWSLLASWTSGSVEQAIIV